MFLKICLFVFVSLIQIRGQGQDLFNLPFVKSDHFNHTKSGLKHHIWRNGGIRFPKYGDKVTVDFVGKLPDQSIFFTTQESGPLSFYLGYGQLVMGFEEAILMLAKGEIGRFVIPYKLGYGNKKYNQIPPKSDLTFDIQLIDILEDELRVPIKISDSVAIRHFSGIKYQILEPGLGTKPDSGDIVAIHYTCFTSDGKILDDSERRNRPKTFIIGDGSAIYAWDAMVRLIAPGGKISFYSPWKSAYGKQGLPPMVASKSDLYFNIELISMHPGIKVFPYIFNGKDSITLSNGLKWYIIVKGAGPKIDSTNIIKVHYSGYFTDGKLFDSSVKMDKPIIFPLYKDLVIQAWRIALVSCNVGDKIKLFVPWKLGYGRKGNKPKIPPKTDLIFDIEILDAF